MPNSEKTKPVATAVVEKHFLEGISQAISRKLFLKFHSNFLKAFRLLIMR